MKPQINLTIAKPCSEVFDSFKKTRAGGFCNQCQTEVKDFRNMSDDQLIEFFKAKPKTTCGLFKKGQLNELNRPQIEFQKTGFSKLFRIAAIAVLSLFSLHTIQAQNDSVIANQVMNSSETQTNLLTGVISDESGPLPGANIMLKDSHVGTSANFDGEYEFPQVLKPGDILLVSYLGYKTQEIKIKANQSVLNVLMPNDSYVLMGKVDVDEVYSSKKGLWKVSKK